MQIPVASIEEYLANVPDERKEAFTRLYKTISENLPKGFQEGLSYGMIGWSVPFETYPDGYHCTPNTPLPFINLASQKNFVALYHMGIYAKPELLNWFVTEFPKHSTKKLDMGKSCVRFKKPGDIPVELIAEHAKNMSLQDWISLYEKLYKKNK